MKQDQFEHSGEQTVLTEKDNRGTGRGRRRDRDKKKVPLTKKQKIKRGVIIGVVSVLLLCLITGGVYAWYTISHAGDVLNEIKDTNTNTSDKKVNEEPFTVLFIGIDEDDMENSLADSLILAAVNPKTKQADLVSIPRDTYAEIPCEGGARDKITHSGSIGGTTCTIGAVEELLDVKVDFYFKINFKGFVSIVDALGGVEMDVPDLREGYAAWEGTGSSDFPPPPADKRDGSQWCDVDSWRTPYAVCFDTFGKQTVNGEQALTLARTRHYDNDQGRSARQAELIKAIAKKMISFDGVMKVNEILDSAKDMMRTNIDASQIADFFALAQNLLAGMGDNADNFAMRTLQVQTGGYLFVGEASSQPLYYGIPYVENLQAITHELNTLLGLAPLTIDTSFSYSVNVDYPVPLIYPGYTLVVTPTPYAGDPSDSSDYVPDTTTPEPATPAEPETPVNPDSGDGNQPAPDPEPGTGTN